MSYSDGRCGAVYVRLPVGGVDPPGMVLVGTKEK